MSLLNRLMMLVFLALVPAAVLRTVREAEVHQTARRVASLIEAEQSRIVEGVRQVLVTLGRTDALRDDDGERCQALLDRLRGDYPEHLSVHVTGPTGTIRCATDGEAVGFSIADRPHVRLALERQGFVIGEHLRQGTNGRAALPFGMPYRDADGRQGVITALLELTWLESHLSDKPLPEGAQLVIADRNGTILARAPEHVGAAGDSLPVALRPLLNAGAPGTTELPGPDGAQRVVAYQPVGSGDGLFIAVGIDKQTATAPMRAAMLRALALIGSVALLTLAAAWLGADRFLRRPLHALADASRRWRMGDLSARTGIDDGSEIGKLARAFDAMAGDLQRQAAVREQANATLLTANREKSELLARHDAMLAHAPVGFALFDCDGRCIRVNEALASLSGHPVEAHTGRTLEQALAAPARVLAPVIEAVLAGGPAVHNREIVADMPGGRSHWLTNVYPVTEDGVVSAVGVVILDITELRDAEAARRRSDERVRSVFDQAAVGIERVALDGRILEANGKLCAILGYTPEELGGLTFRDLTHPDDQAVEEALLDRLLLGDIPSYALEKRYRRKGGAFVCVRVTSSLARITGTEEAYRISIVEDIAERKAAEAALKDGEERLRIALRSAGAGTWDWNMITGVVRWSDEYYELYGIEPGSASPGAESWLAAILPEDRTMAEATLRDVMESRRTDYRSEFRVNHPRLGVRWLAGIGRVVYAEDGAPVRMTGINLDITERKEMEQALHRAKEEAERANLAKTKFLAAASHDLRQPLQSLFFFTAALAGQVSPKGEQTLRHLERGLDALKGLLDSLLDVSRLDAGLVTPDVRDFAASDLLDEINAAYAPVAAAKELLWRVTPGCGVVRSDRTLLSRMLRNLVENALRYTRDGAVAVDCRLDAEAVTIVVRDSGIGIPPDQLDRIWEEFHQVGNPERDRTQGLGLGLAIVRRLSTLLGHPVEVRSAVGQGSEFRIRVALGAQSTRAASAQPMPVANGAGRLAVLVDDDAIVLMGLQAILTEWGYDVLAAGSADQALARLEADGRRPDIVVADYRLREGRVGTEAILRVRALHDDGIPGVILTGETGPECLHDAARHRFTVAHKPITPGELGAALDRQIRAAE